jgi:hypothetical protein
MSDGGLNIHRVGRGLGGGSWEKGISVKPRGLSLGNNILILFQKDICIICFTLSSFGMTCDFQNGEGNVH